MMESNNTKHKFLLQTFRELVGLLKEEEDDSLSSISFTTLLTLDLVPSISLVSKQFQYLSRELHQKIRSNMVIYKKPYNS